MEKKVKCFRCGWCGHPCQKNGRVLTPTQIQAIEPFVDWNKAEQVNGECCPNGDGSRMVQVTREMALDAGDPNLEGEWIDW